MKETCQQERCAANASLRIFWPGKPPTALCDEHGKHAFRVAAVMGIELPSVAIDQGAVAKAVHAMAIEVAENCLRLCLHPARSRIPVRFGVWEWCDDCGSTRLEAPGSDGLWHAPSWRRLLERELAALSASKPGE